MTQKDSRNGPRPSREHLQNARLAGFQIQARKATLLEDSPLSVDLQRAAAKLPEVKLPPLEGIVVEIPPEPPLVDAAVEERMRIRRAMRARGAARGRGEPVQAGDDVIVTFVGFEAGVPKPFAAARRVLLSDASDPLPGMREALVGCPVGESRSVQLDVTYAVRVDEAHAVARVRLVEDEPRERQEAERQVRRDLRAERVAALQNRVLDAVRRRMQLEIPAAVVDTSIQGYWAEAEGAALVAMGIPQDEQKACLKAWREAPALRADVTRRLEASVLVAAYVRARGVTVGPEDLGAHLGELGVELGLSPQDLQRALADDPPRARRIAEQVLHLKAVEQLTREVVGDDVVNEMRGR